jgi:hypothetical protein
MKALRTIFFCFACLLVFLAAGAATSSIRAKYTYLPNVRASLAYSYARLFDEYSLLQSNQAGPEQGKTALLEYLRVLQHLQNGKVEYPGNILHLYTEVTYLRLYQLEMTTNNSAKATEYLNSAESQLALLGHKDIPPNQLIKYIQAREAAEEKLYNGDKKLTESAFEQKSQALKEIR